MLKIRMNRPTYWAYFVLFLIAVSILAYFDKLKGGLELAMILIGIPRLHDIGKSGWMVGGVIGTMFLIVMGAAVAGASADTILLIGGISFLIIVVLGVWLGAIPSEPNANKWGDPPGPGVQLWNARR